MTALGGKLPLAWSVDDDGRHAGGVLPIQAKVEGPPLSFRLKVPAYSVNTALGDRAAEPVFSHGGRNAVTAQLIEFENQPVAATANVAASVGNASNPRRLEKARSRRALRRQTELMDNLRWRRSVSIRHGLDASEQVALTWAVSAELNPPSDH